MKPNFTTKQNVCFFSITTQEYSNSQTSVLLHKLCSWICKSQLSYVDGHAAAVLHFLLMMQKGLLAVPVEPTICLQMSPT
jgi:hypothetical protein